MIRKTPVGVVALGVTVVALVAWRPYADNVTGHMIRGNPAVMSLGAMTFGPENVLFVGDTKGAAIYALDVEDHETNRGQAPINIENIDRRIAASLGTRVEDIVIHDMAVHPASQNVYFSVSRGRGNDAKPVLLKVDVMGMVQEVPLEDIKYSRAEITNAPKEGQTVGRRGTPARTLTVTDLAYADGEVFVAGLSNEEFASNLRRVPFPFDGRLQATSLEIYHVSHGRNETHAPVMTFTPHMVDNELNIVAAYTCTPLVTFPLTKLRNGEHVFGKTIAELGAGNRPLDIIAVELNGSQQLLVANSRHPLMKINPRDFLGATALVSPTKENGVGFMPVEEQGIVQLDNLNRDHVLVLQRSGDGLDLRSLPKRGL